MKPPLSLSLHQVLPPCMQHMLVGINTIEITLSAAFYSLIGNLLCLVKLKDGVDSHVKGRLAGFPKAGGHLTDAISSSWYLMEVLRMHPAVKISLSKFYPWRRSKDVLPIICQGPKSRQGAFFVVWLWRNSPCVTHCNTHFWGWHRQFQSLQDEK